MSIRRGSACALIDVTLGPDPQWPSGPFPVRQWTAESGPLVTPDPADADRRLTYFEERVSEALYRRRWHRSCHATLAGATVQAVEVLRTPLSGPGRGIAVLHVLLPEQPLETLAALAACPLREAATLRDLLPAGTTVTNPRAQTISHLTFTGEAPAILPAEYAAWPAAHQWLWLAASATPFEVFPPDPEDLTVFDGLVRFSRDWRALVLRDGAAFVGLVADPGGDQTFHATAQTHVHSLYLDAFLLGRMQVAAMHDLNNRIAAARTRTIEPRLLIALEYRLMEVRRTLWARHVTVRGRGNDLLTRYQAQHRLPELWEHVVADLGDASRLVEAGTARAINAALGLLTVLGLPFGLAYAAGALLGQQGVRAFLACTAAAVLVALLLVLVFPPVRRMIDALRSVPSV